MALSTTDVRHLAKLARLDLTNAEVAQFATQLSQVLAYVDQLKEVDVNIATEAIANVSGIEDGMRDDVLHACTSKEHAAILEQFPLREGDQLKTSGVFGG